MKTVLIVISTLMLFVGDVKAWEYARGVHFMHSFLPGWDNGLLCLLDKNEIVSEGLDPMDNWEEPPVEYGVRTKIPGSNLYSDTDYRPWYGCTKFDIYMFCTGTYNDPNLASVLTVDGLCDINNVYLFDDKIVLLYSTQFKYGYVYDLRNMFLDCSGSVSIEMIPPAIGQSFVAGQPFATAHLFICDRRSSGGCHIDNFMDFYDYAKMQCFCEEMHPTCDCNDPFYCLFFYDYSHLPILPPDCQLSGDFEGYSFLSKDWHKQQGKYCYDISGINGIPDGYVDFYDLAEFCEYYLK